MCPFLWRFRAGFWACREEGRGPGGDTLCQPLAARIPGWLISLVVGSGCGAECAVAVGCVGGLVVGHLAGEAVPQDLQPAVPQRAESRVVVLAAGALGVVEVFGPGRAAQAGEGPFVHRVGEVAVAGQPVGDDQVAVARAAGDRGAPGIALP